MVLISHQLSPGILGETTGSFKKKLHKKHKILPRKKPNLFLNPKLCILKNSLNGFEKEAMFLEMQNFAFRNRFVFLRESF